MVFVYILLIILFFLDTKPRLQFGKFNHNYISKEYCTRIKGVFVVLVFLAHSCDYFKNIIGGGGYECIADLLYFEIRAILGQLIVVPFLFYSGFGIFESVKSKGKIYVRGFLKNRFLPTYINFATCVCFYFIFDMLLHHNYSLSQILLSFTGWLSIGNSNWFMFVTFMLYILFFISFISARTEKEGLIVFTILSIGLTVILYFLKDSWWWNTILCFTIGMWWSYFKEKLDEIFSKSWFYGILFVIFFVSFIIFFLLAKRIRIFFISEAICFAILICMALMKVQLKESKLFEFLGHHVFSIYILQRLFFILFAQFNLNMYWFLYLPICFIFTIGVATLYDYIFTRIKNLKICF